MNKKILQQVRLLEEVNSLEAVSIYDAVIGNKYVFCVNESHCLYHIGELSTFRKIVNKKANATHYKVVFKNYTIINQLVPNFCGNVSPKINYYETILPLEHLKHVKLYTLHYGNYLNSLK